MALRYVINVQLNIEVETQYWLTLSMYVGIEFQTNIDCKDIHYVYRELSVR